MKSLPAMGRSAIWLGGITWLDSVLSGSMPSPSVVETVTLCCTEATLSRTGTEAV